MNEDLASTMINKFWSEHEDFHAEYAPKYLVLVQRRERGVT